MQWAVMYENQQLTYGELNSRANQLAHYLRSRGVDADVLVGLSVERSLEMLGGTTWYSQSRWCLCTTRPRVSH